MSRILRCVLLFVLGSTVSPAATVDTPVVLGNGALTVSVQPGSGVDTVHWPAPGTFPQTGEPSVPGFEWGVVVDGAAYWTSDAEWKVLDSEFGGNVLSVALERNIAGEPYALTISVFLHPQLDILYSTCNVESSRSVDSLLWRSNLAPVSRRIPETSPPDDLSGPLRGFAAYMREEPWGVIHFRPRNAGASDWEHAQSLAGGQATHTQWKAFEWGTYVGVSSPNSITGVIWEESAMRTSSMSAMASPSASGRVANTSSVARIAPSLFGSELGAMVAVSFAENAVQLEEMMAFAVAPTATQLLQEVRREFVRDVAPILVNVSDRKIAAEMLPRFRLLLAHSNRQTGAAIYGMGESQGHTDAFLESISAAALDFLGQYDEAQKHLDFLKAKVQMEVSSDRPLGTLPTRMWSTGQPASPSYAFNFADPGWFLWAVNQHSLAIPSQHRRVYLQDTWRETEYCADFLSDWILHGAEGVLDEPPETKAVIFLGLVHAIDMAETLSIGIPERWRTAKRRLQFRLEAAVKGGGEVPATGREVLAYIQALPYLTELDQDVILGEYTQLVGNTEVKKDLFALAALCLTESDLLVRDSEMRAEIFQLIANLSYNSDSSWLPPDRQETLPAVLELVALQRLLSPDPQE